MNGSRTIPCPVHGCRRTRQPLHVMCRPCWLKVPKGVRQTVWRLFHEERGSDNHLMAIQAAIDCVQQQQAEADQRSEVRGQGARGVQGSGAGNMSRANGRDAIRVCNCAECGVELVSSHLGSEVAGRIKGRPYCGQCLQVELPRGGRPSEADLGLTDEDAEEAAE